MLGFLIENTFITIKESDEMGWFKSMLTKAAVKFLNVQPAMQGSITIQEAYTYETNLMSFLNYNTKLTGYDIKDDVLTVDFNEYLFDDANSKSILEEVIYSISLSVRDNYDVKEVIFTVNGKEITKSVLKNIE